MMNKGWKENTVKELIEDFSRGLSYSSKDILDANGVPMLSLANIDKTGYYREGDMKFYSGNYSEKDKVYPDEMLIACTDLTRNAEIIGTPIKIAYNAEFLLFTMDLTKLTPKDTISADFLYYALKSQTYRKYIKPWASGTNVLHLNLKGVYDYKLKLPKLKTEQEKIAKVLSNLDKKIQLNQAINHNLEVMAKQLYDYWFVQFDFPNENGKPYKSSGGKMVWNEKLKREIPEGWGVKSLKEIADTYSGGTPKSTNKDYYENGNIPWINSGELNNTIITSTINFITELGFENSSAKIYPSNTIIVALYGATAGKVSLLSFEACSNQAVCGVIPKYEYLNNYLKLYLTSLYNYFISLSSGSARDNISQKTIKETFVLLPTKYYLEEFERILKPKIDEIIVSSNEINYLTKLRDELLPLLMNGQVSVNYDLSPIFYMNLNIIREVYPNTLL